MKLVYDIETDGLDATKIWCMVAHDIESGITYEFSDFDATMLGMADGLELMARADAIIGHNIIGFDNVVLNKLYGWTPTATQKIYDTFVMSQTLRFKRGHKHGLAGWGAHLGNDKIEFDPENFTKGFSQEMLKYCRQDVMVNVDVYKALMKEFSAIYGNNPLISKGLKIEHDTATFNAEVRDRGWKFDKEKALETQQRMSLRMQEIEDIVHPQLGYHTVWIDKAARVPKYKKNGNYTAVTVRHLSEYLGHEVLETDVHLMSPGTEFRRSKEVQTQLGQVDLVKDWLLKDKGWKPDDWTVKKIDGRWVKQSPKFTDTSLEKLGDLGKMISEYYTIRNRASVLDGWLKLVTEGRLHGNMWTIGTPTFRVRHEVIVNLPGVDTPWGRELRELLIADDDWRVVGADSSGNQLRGLCHFVGNDSFTHEVIHGDQHTRNAEILGCSRPLAKNYLYAYLFGAGPAKLGSILTGKPDSQAGKESADRFGKGIKGLAELKERVQGIWKETMYRQGIGWFPALDGRPVFADSEHQCLNYLLQATEGLTCKAALSYAMEKINEEELRAEPRLFYHDEIAYVAHPEDADRVGEILQEAFREAPKWFGVDIMDGGDYVSGDSYADVH